jgi:hypothetical protein
MINLSHPNKLISELIYNQDHIERQVEVEADQKEEGMKHLINKGTGRNSVD